MNRRVLVPLLAVILVALALATLLTGQGEYLIPAAILLGIIGLMALGEFGLKKRIESNYDGDMDAAAADSDSAIPSTHVIKDDDTPLGDTKEAHDELSPHDLPKDHPGRAEAERQADGDRFERSEGVTRGDR